MELVELLDLMGSAYNKEELRDLCFEVEIDYEDLAGEGKKSKIRELIVEMRLQRRLPELFDTVMAQRPWLAEQVGPGVREQIVAIQEAYQGQPRQVTDPFAEESSPAPFQAPPPVPHFTGRQAEIGRLEQHLTQGKRIIGLVGFGGVGKSAVAIQPMAELQRLFPDGVLWANLDHSTPISELTSFAAAYGQAENIAKYPDLATKAGFVRELLAQKKCLIVLDQAQDSEQVKWLLPTGQDNVTLITTRNGKLLTNLDTEIIPIRTFTQAEGRQFLEGAVGKARVTAEAVAADRIIEVVGNLPLALSIVAGFLNEADDLTLAEYAEMLQDEQTRLENLADWEDADRDVAASFELSYQSLPPPIQRLFVALSIFDGPDFSTEAVAAVMKMPLAQVKMGVGRLFFLSLLSGGLGHREGLFPVQADGQGRYRMNPLLRSFARRKLAGEEATLRQRAATYYADLAQQLSLPEGYELLDLEWQNIMGAMHWAYEEQDWASLHKGARALTQPHLGVMGYLDARGRWCEARELLGWLLTGLETIEDPLARAQILTSAGSFAVRQGDVDDAQDYLQQSWTLLESMPATVARQVQQAYVSTLMFQVFMQRDREAARGWFERLKDGLEAISETEAAHEKGHLCISLSAMLGMLGQLAEAQAMAQKGLALLPKELTTARVKGLTNLGLIAELTGKYETSIKFYSRAISEGRKLGNGQLLVRAVNSMATAQLFLGDYAKSKSSFLLALKWASFMGDLPNQTLIHNQMGLLFTRLGEAQQATAHLHKSISLAKERQLEEYEALARMNLAALQLRQETPTAEIQVQLDRAAAICQELALDRLLPELNRLQAQWFWAQNDLQAAQAAIERSLQAAGENNQEAGSSWRVQAQIYVAQGQSQPALSAFRDSVQRLQDQDAYELALSRMALGRYLLRLGQKEEGKALLQQALNAFTRLEARPEIILLTQLMVHGEK